MPKNHLLHLDAIKGIEPGGKLIIDGRLPYHFQDNQAGTGTKAFGHFMEANPGLDVAPVTGEYFLNFRGIFNPVLNVNPQYYMFTILHHVSPFAADFDFIG
jgi:hypothetical protein